jgi:hypothetical protein
LRTEPAFRFGPVRWGESEEKTMASPARAGTATASSTASRHFSPVLVVQWSRAPPRCSPGAIHGQPFSSLTSTSGSQKVRYCSGSMKV